MTKEIQQTLCKAISDCGYWMWWDYACEVTIPVKKLNVRLHYGDCRSGSNQPSYSIQI